MLTSIALEYRLVEDDDRFAEGGFSRVVNLFSHKTL